MADNTSHLRLRSVRWKGGGELRVLPAAPDMREKLRARLDAILSAHEGPLAGFAFVVWSPDGGSSAGYASGGPVLTMALPDFVRERLMAEAVLVWAREERDG